MLSQGCNGQMGKKRVTTVETTFDILELLAEKGKATISELAEQLELANSTIHRHLSTLEQRRYVVNKGGVYQIGLQFVYLGQCAKRQERLFKVAKKKVEEIAEETGERVQFLVKEHGKAVYVHQATGRDAVKLETKMDMQRIPLHASAAGKAILSEMPREAIKTTLPDKVEQYTENTITDKEKLLKDLRKTKNRGYSINDQEFIDGLRAVGVPVNSENSAIIGGLSIGGPIHRMDDHRIKDELADYLIGSAKELELRMLYEE